MFLYKLDITSDWVEIWIYMIRRRREIQSFFIEGKKEEFSCT